MLVFIFIFLISLIFANIYKSKRHLHMIQQNLYNENNRYIKWIFKNSNQFISIDILSITISVSSVFILSSEEFIRNILLVIVSLILILIGLSWRKVIRNDQNKKKLVITSRIKRLIFTITLLYLIPVVFIGLNLDNIKTIWLMILILNIMTYLNCFVVFIAMLINMPIEKCVYL